MYIYTHTHLYTHILTQINLFLCPHLSKSSLPLFLIFFPMLDSSYSAFSYCCENYFNKKKDKTMSLVYDTSDYIKLSSMKLDASLFQHSTIFQMDVYFL